MLSTEKKNYFARQTILSKIFAAGFLIISFAVVCPPAATAQSVYYVAPDGKDGNSGSLESPWSLDKANKSLKPGDTAVLLDGIYTVTPIAPENSGEKDKCIVYCAANNQKAIFKNIDGFVSGDRDSNGPTSVFVDDRSYITIDGIKVLEVKRWVVGVRSNHITIKNSWFLNGSGWENCRFTEAGDGIVVVNNHFQGGTDLLSLDGGSGHYVEGNFFGDASHTGLVLLGVKRSVVKNNTLTNRLWRSMEVESQRHEPYNKSEYNVIEGNIFDYAPNKTIQYAGNNSIIRRNIFKKAAMGFHWANYLGSAKTPEAWYDEHNRFYNNVITNCGYNEIVLDIYNSNTNRGVIAVEDLRTDGYGMVYSTDLFNPPVAGYTDVAYGDNVVKNNIFYHNTNTIQTKSTLTVQVGFTSNATPDFGKFYFNNFFNGETGTDVFYYQKGGKESPAVPLNNSIANFQQYYPGLAANNIEVDPLFVDPGNENYGLKENSPCIDAGGSLTETVTEGEGTNIKVADALYFTDGCGLIDPDVIKVDSQRVTIVGIDYSSNTITVDRNIKWKQGDQVYMDFAGAAPDLGAFEYDTTQTTGITDPGDYNISESFQLLQNYPNPFNPTTLIQFSLAEKVSIRLEIFDVLGRRIKTLINSIQSAGTHKTTWNAKNESGGDVPSGVYFYKLSVFSGGMLTSATKKMIVVK